jgi:mono/diheme cytochrome c family protein
MICLLVVAGCEDPQSDMGDQPKYRPLQYSAAFADGSSARPLVSGVMPRDGSNVPGGPYGSLPTTQPLRAITRATLERGQLQFEIYCAVCHGRLGNGEGVIVQRGLTPPPSYHIWRLRQAPDQHFFDVMTNGYGAMFSYSDRVAPPDRWAIVAYIRALQQASANAPDDVQRAFTAHGDRPQFPAGGRQ